jgi:hypothetical protein
MMTVYLNKPKFFKNVMVFLAEPALAAHHVGDGHPGSK